MLKRLLLKLREWYRWHRRTGWELTHIYATDYAGIAATQLRPYFVEFWRHKESGEVRSYYCT